MNIQAVIFDWGRTLYDSVAKKEFHDAEEILSFCKKKGYVIACASLVSPLANATLEERKQQIESSPLRHYFTCVAVTDQNKDSILDEIVEKLGFPRDTILIVDDRMVRGVQYGNLRGHPTVWFQNGKFSDELPTKETKQPTFTIHSLKELKDIL